VAEAQARVIQAVADIAASGIGGRVLMVRHKHVRALLDCPLSGLELRSFGNVIEEGIQPQPISALQLERLVA
jgi:broad specificity phosphatase PhoE